MTTTTEPTNPIYCVKCRKKTESRNIERSDHEERPVRDNGRNAKSAAPRSFSIGP